MKTLNTNLIHLKKWVLFLFLISCSQMEEIPIIEDDENLEEETFDYTSNNPYNLNVIYFVPSDREENPDYHKRISEIMLDGQAFFLKYMKHWDYGEKTFGLLKDQSKNRVKIHVIRGEKPASAYPYEGGGNEIRKEVDAYFAESPSEKSSDHYLIISSVNNPATGGANPADVPFYGMGRYAYALDYPGMSIEDLGKDGVAGSEATKWIGGLLHEMGHGLNLPHCKEKVSEASNPNMGTSLMGAGNYTYGKSPTCLTHSSAAYLNNCQVFAETQGNFYGPVNSSIKTILAKYENGHIHISGTFESDVPVTDITFSNRPETDAGGYQAVKWVEKPDGNGFEVNMPISEFWEKDNMGYDFSIVRHHTNGANTSTAYAYTFENDIPMINFGDRDELDKNNWTILDFSSEETSGEGSTGRISDVIDGKPETYWHSRWTSNASDYPHHFTIDMSQIQAVNGLSITQRNGQRRIKDYKLYVSDNNSDWELLISSQIPNLPGRVYIDLEETASFRYFKFEAISSHDGQQFAALAEIGFY
ncbi:discoidin domain-containing protein [Belliella marina]|uniref:Discoidin domain-containing protein n=1 Tax=Belliella marina TaxID=1644146 RepID=A0ABW4VRQ2_9BACT